MAAVAGIRGRVNLPFARGARTECGGKGEGSKLVHGSERCTTERVEKRGNEQPVVDGGPRHRAQSRRAAAIMVVMLILSVPKCMLHCQLEL